MPARVTSTHTSTTKLSRSIAEMAELKGLLLKRKDYLGVDEEAGSHPNRTYYYKKNADLDNVLTTCSKSLEVWTSE
jgi:hypothetical protein